MTGWDVFGIWIGVGLTLVMYSFLYKDNPIFRFGEHLYLGVSVGYLLVIAVFQTLRQQVWGPLLLPLAYKLKESGGVWGLHRYLNWATQDYTGGTDPNYWLLIPLALGFLIYLRLSGKLAWVSRYTFALIVGVGSGTSLPRTISANLLKQLFGTVEPFLKWGEMTAWQRTSQIIVVVGVLCTVSYFLFSVEHKGPLRVTSKIGIWFLMVSFGATFGYTVMGRMALFTDRLQTLIDHSRWDPTPFRVQDVSNWGRLAAKLEAGGTPAGSAPAQRIWESFSDDSRKAAQEMAASGKATPEGKRAILGGLNAAVSRNDLYREADFQGLKLSPEVKALSEKKPADRSSLEATRLNRLLVQAAFATELARVGATPFCATWAWLVAVIGGLIAWERLRTKTPTEGVQH